MVSVNNTVPSSVIVDEISRSLSTTGERSTDSIPLILQTETPPTVSHVNTVDWFRKTVVFSGFFTNSEERQTDTLTKIIPLVYIYLVHNKEL